MQMCIRNHLYKSFDSLGSLMEASSTSEEMSSPSGHLHRGWRAEEGGEGGREKEEGREKWK